jgi:hypothetical protein
MAPQYQRGRSISYDPNVQLYTTIDNMVFGRKMSEGSRTFQISWSEPIDTTQIYTKDPNYWLFSELEQPIANYGDLPLSIIGISQHLAALKPIVYIPHLPYDYDDYTTYILNRSYNHAMVRLDGTISIDSVMGDEEKSELFRVATVTLKEVE